MKRKKLGKESASSRQSKNAIHSQYHGAKGKESQTMNLKLLERCRLPREERFLLNEGYSVQALCDHVGKGLITIDFDPNTNLPIYEISDYGRKVLAGESVPTYRV